MNDESIECSSLLMEENGNQFDSSFGKSFRVSWTDLSVYHNLSNQDNYANYFRRIFYNSSHQILTPMQDERLENDFEDKILVCQSGKLNSGTINAIVGDANQRQALIQAIIGRKVTGNISDSRARALSMTGNVTLISSESRDSLLKVSVIPDIYPDENDSRYIFNRRSTVKQILEEAMMFNNRTRALESVSSGLKLSQYLNKKISDCPTPVIKLLNIAVELISCPDILVIDSVISDIETLRIVSKYFKSNDCHAVNKHMMVIVSISGIDFKNANELFDTIYVLNARGRKIVQDEVSKLPLIIKSNDTSVDNYCDLIESVKNMKKTLISTTDADNNENISNRDIVTAPMNIAVQTEPSKETLINLINLIRRQVNQVKNDPISIFLPTLISVVFLIFLSILFKNDIGISDGCLNTIIDLDKFFGNQSFAHFLTQSTPASIFNHSMVQMTLVIDNVKYFLIIINFLLMMHSIFAVISTKRTLIRRPTRS